MFFIVSVKFSHTQQVQFAAVSPPRRMSSNTERLQLEMIRPSKMIASRCSSAGSIVPPSALWNFT